METSTGIFLGKLAFYAALSVLVIVLIIKKRKQIKSARDQEEINHSNHTKP